MEVKMCAMCHEVKSLSEFPVSGRHKDGTPKRHVWCKSCHCAYENARYHERTSYLNSRRDKCRKCGETRFYVLDFHHIDEEDKDFTLGQLRKRSMESLEKELNKCVVLCSNCHRAFHYVQRTFSISLEEFLNSD